MITLRLNNSYSQIIGLDSSQHKALRQILSYEIDSQAAYFSNAYNTRRYLVDNKGTYPSGLTPLVTRYLRQNALKCSVIDDRIKPTKTVDLKGKFEHTPYRVQCEAVNAAITQGQASISMCTGSGKSNVIAMLIDKLKLRTLVVTPNLELKRQLTASLEESFGKTKHIIVENIDSSALDSITDFDVLIIDESHHAAAKTYISHNKKHWNRAFYRFFLSATPIRTKSEENILLQSVAGQLCYELPYKKAVKLGIVVPVEAYCVKLPKVKTNAYTWQEVYSELVTNNTTRNQAIAELLTNFTAAGVSTLCLVKEIKHGNLISELTGVPFANGQDVETRPWIKDFSNKRLTSLIGTEGVVGEGVDTKACEIVIIAGLGKASGAFQQKIGRAIRKYPGKESAKVIIFKDSTHRFTLSHFNAQKKILMDIYGCDVVELEV